MATAEEVLGFIEPPSPAVLPSSDDNTVASPLRRGRLRESLGGPDAAWLPASLSPLASPTAPPLRQDEAVGPAIQAQRDRPNREGVVTFWKAQGVPQHVADGIADAVSGESGFNPSIMGDSGTSGGMYQHHDERLARLKAFAAIQGKTWDDPAIQNVFALQEVKGGDPIATAHWQEIISAPDRATAKLKWQQYFERPASLGGQTSHGFDVTQWSEDQRRIYKEYGDKANSILDEALKQSPGSAERHRLLREAMDHSKALADEFREKAHKPPKPMSDFEAMSEWAPLMVGLFTLAGAFTRRPALGALRAASGALEGLHKGNQEQYQLAHDQWKEQNNLALKSFEFENDEIKHILQAEELDETERSNKLRVALQVLGINRDTALAFSNAPKDAADWLQKRELVAAQIKEHGAHAEYWHALGTGGALTASKNIQILDKNGNTVWQGAAREGKLGAGWVRSDTGEPVEMPEGGSIRIAGAQQAVEPLSGDAIRTAAERVLAGDHSAVVGLGYGTVGANNRTKINNMVAQLGKEQGLSGAAIAAKQAEFAGRRAELQAVGRREALILTAGKEAERLIPQVLETSAKVSRTEFSDINNILLAGERRTGDPSVVRFGIAINSFINTYGRALSPTGVATVSDKDHARELLQTGWSKGQINAAMDQLRIELNAALKAPDDVWEDVIGYMREGQPRGPEFVKRAGSGGPSSDILPVGIPQGSRQIGTRNGNPVYKAPDGGRYEVHP